MSDKLLTFENLESYDQQIKTKISQELARKVNKSVYDIHSHELKDLADDTQHKLTNQVDIDRTTGFRRCLTDNNASGPIQINTNNYDMAYLTLSGAISIQLKDVDFDPSEDSNLYRGSKARHIKIIVKNPSAGITWPSSVVWINENNPPTYTSGSDKVDVIDLFTPDGDIWFANIMQSWSL